jgi:hypothetical protein
MYAIAERRNTALLWRLEAGHDTPLKCDRMGDETGSEGEVEYFNKQ